MTMPFGITESDLKSFQEKQISNIPDDLPIRDENTTFFKAVMSEEADFQRQGFVSGHAVELLGP